MKGRDASIAISLTGVVDHNGNGFHGLAMIGKQPGSGVMIRETKCPHAVGTSARPCLLFQPELNY